MGNEVWIESKVRRFIEICAIMLWMVAWFAFAKALCLASLGLKGDLHLVLLGSSLMFIEFEDFSIFVPKGSVDGPASFEDKILLLDWWVLEVGCVGKSNCEVKYW